MAMDLIRPSDVRPNWSEDHDGRDGPCGLSEGGGNELPASMEDQHGGHGGESWAEYRDDPPRLPMQPIQAEPGLFRAVRAPARPPQISTSGLQSASASCDWAAASGAGSNGPVAFQPEAEDLAADHVEDLASGSGDRMGTDFSFEGLHSEDVIARTKQRIREVKERERLERLREQERREQRKHELDAQHHERLRRVEHEKKLKLLAQRREEEAKKFKEDEERRQEEERRRLAEERSKQLQKQVQARLRAQRERERREHLEQEERHAEDRVRSEEENEQKWAQAREAAIRRLREQKKAEKSHKEEQESLDALEADYEHGIEQEKRAEILQRRAQERVKQKLEVKRREEEERRLRYDEELRKKEERAAEETRELEARRERAAHRAALRLKQEKEAESRLKSEKEEQERAMRERRSLYKNPRAIAELKAHEKVAMPLAEEQRKRALSQKRSEQEKLRRYAEAKEQEEAEAAAHKESSGSRAGAAARGGSGRQSQRAPVAPPRAASEGPGARRRRNSDAGRAAAQHEDAPADAASNGGQGLLEALPSARSPPRPRRTRPEDPHEAPVDGQQAGSVDELPLPPLEDVDSPRLPSESQLKDGAVASSPGGGDAHPAWHEPSVEAAKAAPVVEGLGSPSGSSFHFLDAAAGANETPQSEFRGASVLLPVSPNSREEALLVRAEPPEEAQQLPAAEDDAQPTLPPAESTEEAPLSSTAPPLEEAVETAGIASTPAGHQLPAAADAEQLDASCTELAAAAAEHLVTVAAVIATCRFKEHAETAEVIQEKTDPSASHDHLQEGEHSQAEVELPSADAAAEDSHVEAQETLQPELDAMEGSHHSALLDVDLAEGAPVQEDEAPGQEPEAVEPAPTPAQASAPTSPLGKSETGAHEQLLTEQGEVEELKDGEIPAAEGDGPASSSEAAPADAPAAPEQPGKEEEQRDDGEGQREPLAASVETVEVSQPAAPSSAGRPPPESAEEGGPTPVQEDHKLEVEQGSVAAGPLHTEEAPPEGPEGLAPSDAPAAMEPADPAPGEEVQPLPETEQQGTEPSTSAPSSGPEALPEQALLAPETGEEGGLSAPSHVNEEPGSAPPLEEATNSAPSTERPKSHRGDGAQDADPVQSSGPLPASPASKPGDEAQHAPQAPAAEVIARGGDTGQGGQDGGGDQTNGERPASPSAPARPLSQQGRVSPSPAPEAGFEAPRPPSGRPPTGRRDKAPSRSGSASRPASRPVAFGEDPLSAAVLSRQNSPAESVRSKPREVLAPPLSSDGLTKRSSSSQPFRSTPPAAARRTGSFDHKDLVDGDLNASWTRQNRRSFDLAGSEGRAVAEQVRSRAAEVAAEEKTSAKDREDSLLRMLDARDQKRRGVL